LAELRYCLAFGSSVEDMADFLHRDVEEVRHKIAIEAQRAGRRRRTPLVPPRRSVILDTELREHARGEPFRVMLAGPGKLDDPERGKFSHAITRADGELEPGAHGFKRLVHGLNVLGLESESTGSGSWHHGAGDLGWGRTRPFRTLQLAADKSVTEAPRRPRGGPAGARLAVAVEARAANLRPTAEQRTGVGHGGVASGFARWMPRAAVQHAVDVAPTPKFPEWPHCSEHMPTPAARRPGVYPEGWRARRRECRSGVPNRPA
jgi:hypothetical protein